MDPPRFGLQVYRMALPSPGQPWQPIRRPIDDQSSLSEPTASARHSEASVVEARRITFVFGDRNRAVDAYEQLFGYAPPHNLQALRRRGAIVVMAPSIADWLASPQASTRRGRELIASERRENERDYAAGSGIAAIYDPETDSLVLPTWEVSPDPLHPVLHELGHALTLRRAWVSYRHYVNLLRILPRRIQRHLERGYPSGDDDEAVRVRVAEMFAEAYAMVLGGRHDELPPELASALIAILGDVSDTQSAKPGWSIDPATGRTATYCRPSDMVRHDVPAAKPADSLPPLTQAGDRGLLERQAETWPPSEHA
jgi:hypothetical protein